MDRQTGPAEYRSGKRKTGDDRAAFFRGEAYACSHFEKTVYKPCTNGFWNTGPGKDRSRRVYDICAVEQVYCHGKKSINAHIFIMLPAELLTAQIKASKKGFV